MKTKGLAHQFKPEKSLTAALARLLSALLKLIKNAAIIKKLGLGVRPAAKKLINGH